MASASSSSGSVPNAPTKDDVFISFIMAIAFICVLCIRPCASLLSSLLKKREREREGESENCNIKQTPMASASSSSGSGPNAPRKYDVFISFRGETRNNFTSHLHAALKRAFLEVFLDDRKLETGEEIKLSLIQAIKDSSVSVIVFSKDYASSKWCLDELAQIMQYRKEEGQFVIPIFYKVNPRNVRNQTTGAYKKAFKKHEMDYPTDRVNTWRAALSEAGKLSGTHCQASTRDETKLINDIVSDVITKLEDIPNWRVTLKGVIGRDEMIEPIKELLEKSHKVGIWGMGGVGKTTMAKVVFATLSSQYDSRCFLENVRDKTEKNGLEHVRNCLVSKLLGEDVQIDLSNEESVVRRLGRTKAFVVLDDVDIADDKQLKDLLDNTCNFLEGSKVIVTTRDKKLLKGRKDYEIYEAKGLSYENSRRLFIHKAFGSDNPEDGYEELIEGFVGYAKHNPLASEVLGSHVQSEDKQLWGELLRRLRHGNPDEKIQEVLKLSYERLNPKEKQIFLDIACFLKDESEEFVKELMKSYGFYPTVGMKTLKDRALVNTIGGKVQMHDLIQEMGHQIVREESINEPGKRSRLWDPRKISDVLENCEGEKEVEGMIMSKSFGISPSKLTTKSFNKMKRLRFLKLYSPHYWVHDVTTAPIGLLESISTQIRYFHWEGYPVKSLPSKFCAKHLLELNLNYGMVETLWKGVQDLANLRRLNLNQCYYLRELPDFSKACRLESVYLSDCSSLTHVHASLLSRQSLISLVLRSCTGLESLQSSVHLKCLEKVDVFGCNNLKEFSMSSEELTSLHLAETKIEELSPSIVRCAKLRSLILEYKQLKNLPIKVLSCLTFLEELHVSLMKIDNDDLRQLFNHLRSLQSLKLQECRNLTELPDNITQLSSLEKLYLSECPDLTKLPDNMRHLSKLQLFCVRHCAALQSLPKLSSSLSQLYVSSCTSLKTVSTLTTSCSFLNCFNLDLGAIEEQTKLLLEKAVREKKNVRVSYPGNKVPKWFAKYQDQNKSGIDKYYPGKKDLRGLGHSSKGYALGGRLGTGYALGGLGHSSKGYDLGGRLGTGYAPLGGLETGYAYPFYSSSKVSISGPVCNLRKPETTPYNQHVYVEIKFYDVRDDPSRSCGVFNCL